MPIVKLISPDGTVSLVDAADGQSLMMAATGAGVDGIVAECGGSAMCATCHVYVDPTWVARLPAPSQLELAMLECAAAERRTGSRLSCQIKLDASLDGLLVRIPDRQH